jgi:hypothetical protein
MVSVCALAIVSFAERANAAIIIDQSCCGGVGAINYSFGGLTRVQTFTVGTSGLMTGIDVGLTGTVTSVPGFALFEGAFVTGDATAAFGAPLATLSMVNSGEAVPSGGFPATYFYSGLGAGIEVLAGQQFSIVEWPGGVGGGWLGANSNVYSGGQSFTTTFLLSGALNPTLAPQNNDFVFRTYIETAAVTPVPEPASMLFLGTGLFAVAGRFRRSRMQAAV